MPTIGTQTNGTCLNMSGDVAVKRNKMTNLNNKDKREWLRARYGKDWYKENKKMRVEDWKRSGHLSPHPVDDCIILPKGVSIDEHLNPNGNEGYLHKCFETYEEMMEFKKELEAIANPPKEIILGCKMLEETKEICNK